MLGMRQNLLRIFPMVLTLACASRVPGQGTIVYNNPQDVPFFGEYVPYDLDIDQNGETDFRVLNTGDFAAYGVGGNASLAVPEQPPDLGALITPLSYGEYIGPSLTPPNAWFETYSFEPLPGFPVTVPAYFHGCTTIGCVGAFHEVTAYWGVQFSIDGELHYGWVQMATPQLPPGIFASGGTLLDWAYNTVPGQPIFAGQVPEPATWLLIAAGGLVAFFAKRRPTPTVDRPHVAVSRACGENVPTTSAPG